ncbi:MAG: hypothetical protein IJO43_00035 [Bacilli bacterium]|nr:hypothetical protein [Bacilli bacterium]
MEKTNKKTVEEIITTIFNDVVEEHDLQDVAVLKIINSKFRPAGSVVIKKNADKVTIRVNKNKVSKAKTTSVNMIYQAYQIISHEKEHVKTIHCTKSKDFYSYEHLLALMEYLYYANRYNVDFENISFDIISSFLIKAQLNKNYDLSPGEIIANLNSYIQLYEKFEGGFSKETEDNFSSIISSLNFLNDNMEVYYNEFGEPINRFMIFVTNTGAYIRKNPKVYDQYQILSHLFERDGSLKSIYEIYSNINNENEPMYQKIMTSYLTSIDCDYSEYLSDNGFKSYIEKLMGNYITGTIDYYNNLNKGLLFVDSKKPLSDNLILKKKNVQIITRLANKYNLHLSSGTIIDSNNVYVNKLTI